MHFQLCLSNTEQWTQLSLTMSIITVDCGISQLVFNHKLVVQVNHCTCQYRFLWLYLLNTELFTTQDEGCNLFSNNEYLGLPSKPYIQT